jgi:hypothetical protein
MITTADFSYQQKVEEVEAVAAEKRARKAEEVKAALEKDPFGASLSNLNQGPGIFHQTGPPGDDDD